MALSGRQGCGGRRGREWGACDVRERDILSCCDPEEKERRCVLSLRHDLGVFLEPGLVCDVELAYWGMAHRNSLGLWTCGTREKDIVSCCDSEEKDWHCVLSRKHA